MNRTRRGPGSYRDVSKQNSDEIVTFRVTKARHSKMVEYKDSVRIVGVRSHHQLARKLVLDFLDGRLVYLKDSHKYESPRE